MTTKPLLDAATAFLKAFGVVALAATIGLLSLPNYQDVGALALAGFCAALAAGFAALQAFVPALSVRRLIAEPWGSAIDAGIHAGLATFLTLAAGWLNAPDFSAWHAFVVGLVVAVGNAALRAAQGKLFGDHPQPAGLPRKAGPRATAAPPPPELALA